VLCCKTEEGQLSELVKVVEVLVSYVLAINAAVVKKPN